MTDDEEARVPAHDLLAMDDSDDGIQREKDAGVSPHGRRDDFFLAPASHRVEHNLQISSPAPSRP